MITSPTLFILGAGASMPYGFPSARGLLDQVAYSLTKSGDRSIIAGMGLTNTEELLGFERDLLESGLNSVDAFLEHRREFLEIGRAMIAFVIARAESNCDFFNKSAKSGTARQDDPYNYLLNALWSAESMSVSAGRARFVTFNYDRSLEAYLTAAVRARRGCSQAEAFADVDRLGIVHVYGSLGSISPSGGEHWRAFGAGWSDPEENIKSARSLSLIGDHRDDRRDDRFHRGAESGSLDSLLPNSCDDHTEASAMKEGIGLARELAFSSDRIVFLGFGYDKRNLARIKPVMRLLEPEIRGTTCGMKQAERRTAEILLQQWGAYRGRDEDVACRNVSICGEGLRSELYLRSHLRLSS